MLEPHRHLKVFLCHASQDKPAVRELFHRLNSEGWIDPWLDEKKLLPGQDWQLEIEKAVETSDIVLIFLSRNSVSKEGYVQKEYRYARDIALEKPEGTIFIIPLRLDDCEVPRGLRSFQWADYFGEGKKECYDALVHSLRLRYDQQLARHEKEWEGVEKRAQKQAGTSTKEIKPLPLPISIVQSFPAPGRKAEGITWDGVNLWLTDNSASIFKVDTSGAARDVYQSPEGTPQGITWDGSGFWVYTTNRSLIYHLQISGGQRKVLGSFQAPTEVIGGGVTQDLAWDGNSLWYANQYRVYHLEPSGRVAGYLPFSKNIMGVTWDGSNLWLACQDTVNSALIVVDTTGKTLATHPAPLFEIDGLAWADGTLWALGIDSPGEPSMVHKLQINHH